MKGIETDDNKEPTDTVFGSFVPEPDWTKIPLAEKDLKEYSFSDPRGDVGELPVMSDDPMKGLRFQSPINKTTDGITGECITGELSGIATR